MSYVRYREMSKKITITEKQSAEPHNFTLDLWRALDQLEEGEGVHIAPIGTYVKRKNGELYYYNQDGDRMDLDMITLMNGVRSFYRGDYRLKDKYRVPADAEEIQVPRHASLMVSPVDDHYAGMLRTTLGSLVAGGKVTVSVYARYGKRKAPITIERTEDGYVLTHKGYTCTATRRRPIVQAAIERAKTRPSVA